MNTSKQRALLNPDSTVTVLTLIVLDSYGMEAIQWDPETIQMELETDAHAKIPEDNLLKIGCGMTLMGTDAYYTSLPDFISMTNIIAQDLDCVNMFKPSDAYDIVAGVTEALLLNPPDEMTQPFTEEITAYIALMLRTEGILTPPQNLGFVPKDFLAIADLGTCVEDSTIFEAGYEQAIKASDDIQAYEDAWMHEIGRQIREVNFEKGDTTWMFEKKES